MSTTTQEAFHCEFCGRDYLDGEEECTSDDCPSIDDGTGTLKNYSVRLRETGEIVARFTERNRILAEELAEDSGFEMLFHHVVEEPTE